MLNKEEIKSIIFKFIVGFASMFSMFFAGDKVIRIIDPSFVEGVPFIFTGFLGSFIILIALVFLGFIVRSIHEFGGGVIEIYKFLVKLYKFRRNNG